MCCGGVQWPGLGLRGALTFSINNNTIYVCPATNLQFISKYTLTKCISNWNIFPSRLPSPCLCSDIEAGDVCSQSRPFWWPRLYPLPVRVTPAYSSHQGCLRKMKTCELNWTVDCPPLLHSCLGWKGNRLQWPLADFHTLLILPTTQCHNNLQLAVLFSILF